MNAPCTINHSLEYIYDKYSPVMYGIAFRISSNEKEAEKILTSAFLKIHQLKIFELCQASLCFKLIKITVETAYALFPKYRGVNLDINQFKKLPILYRLICENINLESLCSQYGITTPQLLKRLHGELSLSSYSKKSYLVRAIVAAD